MSTGLCFFRKVLDNKGPGAFLDTYQLRRADFTKDEIKVLDYIEAHLEKFSKIPSTKTVEKRLQFRFPDIPDEPLEFWASEVKKRAVTIEIQKSVKAAVDELRDGDPDKAAGIITDLATNLIAATGESKVRTLQELAQEVMELHDKRAMRTSDLRIPFGLPTLDDITDGAQRGDNVVLAGPTGVGKTVTLCYFANSAYAIGRRVLVLTLEMTRQQMATRLIAWQSGVNERIIRRGQLAKFGGRPPVNRAITQLEAGPPFYILDGAMVFEVEDLMVYIRALKPDVVYIDGADLVQTRNAQRRGKWEQVVDAVEYVKRTAIRANVPIIGAYQLNDEGNIYGGRRIEHMASIVMKMTRPRKQGKVKRGDSPWDEELPNARDLVIDKGRFGELGTVRLDFYPEKSFIAEAI